MILAMSTPQRPIDHGACEEAVKLLREAVDHIAEAGDGYNPTFWVRWARAANVLLRWTGR